MNAEIIQKFKGTIDGIIIGDENIYYTMCYLLEEIEEKFGQCYTQEFIHELYCSIDRAYYKYEYFEFGEFEQSINIQGAKRFEDIEFNYLGCTYRFDYLNEELAKGAYSRGQL